MSKQSIAAMRASGRVRQPTITKTICLSSDLADEYRAKREELVEAVGALERAQEEAGKRPGRAGGSSAVRKARKQVDDLSDELDALAEQMAAFEVDVVCERKSGGDWNRWTEAHPPREKEADELGRRMLVIRDAQHGGRCDFDALVDALPDWVTTLNGQPLGDDGDWDWVASQASPADLDDLADELLGLHGSKVSIPKSLKPSLSMLLGESDSTSPETGTPARNGSTAGSRSGKPSTSTTTTDA